MQLFFQRFNATEGVVHCFWDLFPDFRAACSAFDMLAVKPDVSAVTTVTEVSVPHRITSEIRVLFRRGGVTSANAAAAGCKKRAPTRQPGQAARPRRKFKAWRVDRGGQFRGSSGERWETRSSF